MPIPMAEWTRVCFLSVARSDLTTVIFMSVSKSERSRCLNGVIKEAELLFRLDSRPEFALHWR